MDGASDGHDAVTTGPSAVWPWRAARRRGAVRPAASRCRGAQIYDVPRRRVAARRRAPDLRPGGPARYTRHRGRRLPAARPGDGQGRADRARPGSSPHGVIVGPDGAPGHRRAIERHRASIRRRAVMLAAADERLRQPQHRDLRQGRLTVVHRPVRSTAGFDPATGKVEVWDRRGCGPYGIATTANGDGTTPRSPWQTSRASTLATGAATVIEPPTPEQGARAWAIRASGLGQRVDVRARSCVRPWQRRPGARGSCPVRRRARTGLGGRGRQGLAHDLGQRHPPL